MPESKPTQAEVISAFVEKMMQEKGTDDAELKTQLETKLEEQVEMAMVRVLPDEKLAELEQMVDSDDLGDEKVEKFFENSGVDFQGAIEQTMNAFREAFLNSGKVGA